jgi:hypothetical protein
MKNSASQLGFTPSDRARITGRKSTTKKGEANPLDEFG